MALIGLLYTDLSSVLSDVEEGYVPTDGSTINVVLAETLLPIFGLFAQ